MLHHYSPDRLGLQAGAHEALLHAGSLHSVKCIGTENLKNEMYKQRRREGVCGYFSRGFSLAIYDEHFLAA
jgi:hypothetical protein